MVHMLTAATPELPEKFWNLVDWLSVTYFSDSIAMVGALNIIGALLCIAIPYLLGSINPAIILSRRVYGKDLRECGEDAGGGGMRRIYGMRAGVITMLLDVLKASVAVWFGLLLWETNGGAVAGFFVVFGHMFPIFHRFKGGRGLACLAAAVFTIDLISFVVLLFIFAVCAIGTRMVSFGTMMAALMYPLILNAFENRGLNVAMAVVTTLFVLYVHRENIKRIREGKETKFELRRKKGDKESSQ